MSSTKLIAIVGATGTQGSSVVSTFLSEPGWRIRGITRNPNSDASLALSAKGVEMVAADLNDTQTLIHAFQGAHAVFAVTDFFSSFIDPASQAKLKPGQTINEYSYEHEKRQAMNLMDAVSTVGTLERFVWSGLSAAKKWSRGKYAQVYHFDSKAEATEYLKTTYPEIWAKTSVIMVGFYLENALRSPLIIPRKTSDGVYEIAANNASSVLWPYIETRHDTGIFVRALILDVPAGKNLYAYRKLLSIEDFLKLWGKVNGVAVRFREISFDEMVEAAGMLGREGAEAFAYATDFGYEGRDDPTVVHPKDLGIPVALPSVEDWIKKQDWSSILKA